MKKAKKTKQSKNGKTKAAPQKRVRIMLHNSIQHEVELRMRMRHPDMSKVSPETVSRSFYEICEHLGVNPHDALPEETRARLRRISLASIVDLGLEDALIIGSRPTAQRGHV